ncbi:acyl-CoA dehydrogenase family protein [Desulfomonile tiedjei]|uniref:Acyl-CoA dehydrogenase n=1 Tax=Desulfomonile tiedjei (strain ATCC 49306 / DSM 6799 / DCB-1) TaxID=706587 RepID=I4C3E3_DESTA|nr:acyl-CoA dehydrogenase family protein [Desulfomonile tiedjei]AFM24084.1 acyl-CoA dehydrogenase [Desulfomonile tiedjei DSM 6799]
MEYTLSDDQRNIVEAARKFATKEFPQVARECDRDEKFPRELWQKAGELGFMGIFISPEYGGLGLGILEHAMVMEEFWRVDPGVGNILLAVFGAEILGAFGTAEQKQKYLPAIAEGKAIMGCAITEPNAGSDIFGVKTRAARTENGYRISGTKQFITNGSIADFLVVFCLTNPDAEPTKQFSFVMIERDRKGFTSSKLTGKMGIRASDTAELSFDEVEVPAENLIGGKEGQGFRQVMHLFNLNRIVAAAQGVGVAQGALDKAISYVKERSQFGSPLASFQGLQFKLAEMAADIESARLLYHKAAWSVDNGTIDRKLISIAKLLSGKTAVRVTDEALQLHGGYGYMAEYDVERFYRDAKIVEIYEGTKEIEKVTIARELLK